MSTPVDPAVAGTAVSRPRAIAAHVSGDAIRTEKLTKFYGSNRGIVDLDLTVRDGEVFGFLGPNGAGKTTTIRILMDLIRPTSGRASIFGMDCREQAVEIKRIVGYLPGELALWDALTGRQILAYLSNLRSGVDMRYAHALAERLQLDLDKKFREYSKGNKQKVGLVQAFMHRPRLLILDEPTAGLDPLNQQEFNRMVAESREQGQTIFLSSHVLSEVEAISDRVGIVREGQLVRVGALDELVAEKAYRVTVAFDQPVSDDVKSRFASLPNVMGVEATEHELSFAVVGSLDPVIKLAAAYRVLSFTSHEPTLEEQFLQYYRHDAGS
jgi:ABC-2 type transport system ATP-binding protein